MSTTASGEVGVLVPAAGAGTRLGGRRKQFRLLGGLPLLVQTLLVFERHPEVHHLVVATPADAFEEVADALRSHGVTKLTAVVLGGPTRQASVCETLKQAPPSVAFVLVHDAVRPFVYPDQITTVLQKVRTEGAAALALPMADTVRRGEGGTFGETVSRKGLYRMQTPQGFRRDWLEAAHAEAARRQIEATDDVALVQQMGHPVQIVRGSTRNIKITTPDDWALAQALWPTWKSAMNNEQ